MIPYYVLMAIIVGDFGLEWLLKKYQVIKSTSQNNDFVDNIIAVFFKYRVITIIALVFMTMFRDNSVGLDTNSYYQYYTALKSGDGELFVTSISNSYEIGFTILVSIIAFWGLDFRFLSLIVALIVSICLMIFINKVSLNKFMSFALYVALGVFAQSLSAMRQIISMVLILLSVMYLISNRWIVSTIIIVLASLFHVSAIVCLIIVPLKYFKLNIPFVLIMFSLAMIGAVCLPFMLKVLERFTPFDYYSKYFVDFKGFVQETDIVNILYNCALLGIFLIMFIARNKYLKFDEKTLESYNVLLMIYMFVPIVRFIGWILNMQALSNRVSMYFFTILIVLIPLFLEGLKWNNKLYRLSLIGVYIIAFGYMYYIYSIKLSCGVVPYIFKL